MFGWRRAVRLLQAGRIMRVLKAAGCSLLPTNERQVRPLAGLDNKPQLATAAWKQALQQAGMHAGSVTGGMVAEALAQLLQQQEGRGRHWGGAARAAGARSM